MIPYYEDWLEDSVGNSIVSNVWAPEADYVYSSTKLLVEDSLRISVWNYVSTSVWTGVVNTMWGVL
jgi:hypothetical protein